MNYESPLRVKTKLVNKRTGETREQEVYLGDLPVMTDRGTFIVNGIERVVVSQLVRSAGAFFTAEVARARRYYGAKVIPNRGAWLEFETDTNNVIWVKIDRKRKVAATSLLRAFGYSTDDEIKNLFTEVLVDRLAREVRNSETLVEPAHDARGPAFHCAGSGRRVSNGLGASRSMACIQSPNRIRAAAMRMASSAFDVFS